MQINMRKEAVTSLPEPSEDQLGIVMATLGSRAEAAPPT